MSTVPANFACERCGREASEIPACPERPSGLCPFLKEWSVRRPDLLVIGGFLTFALVVVLGMWKNPAWPCIPLAIIGIWALVRETKFYNGNSGTQLQCTTVAGIELRHRWTSRGELLPIRLEPSQSNFYPFSIIALAALPTGISVSTEEAASVFRAALLHLLTKECIEVYLFHSYITGIWQGIPSVVDDYIITASQNANLGQGGGELEERIMGVIKWARFAQKEGAGGRSIYELVRALYEQDVISAPKWLAKLVAADAVARGYGRYNKKFFGTKFEWNANHISQLQEEQRAIEALSQRLVEICPEFSLALDQQIPNAINSRETSD